MDMIYLVTAICLLVVSVASLVSYIRDRRAIRMIFEMAPRH